MRPPLTRPPVSLDASCWWGPGAPIAMMADSGTANPCASGGINHLIFQFWEGKIITERAQRAERRRPRAGGHDESKEKENGELKADTKTEEAVLAVLKRMAEGYSKRDLDGILALFLPDPDVIMYGTGADEKRVGLSEVEAQVKRDWAQSEATSMVLDWHSISAAGPVAWMAADMAFKAKVGGDEITLPGRLTTVLERRGEDWLIAQAHFSFPAGGQAQGQSF
jgi:ketosteroid isomerase-like protein